MTKGLAVRLLIAGMVLCAGLCANGGTDTTAAASVHPPIASNGPTFIIPIEGPIEKALLYVIRRGLAQAAERQAGAVVFVIDTPGGQLDATEEIIRLLLQTRVPTYTLVQSRALSAGAIIAMATDRIYMTPGSIIGDALPIMITPFGGVQELPEAVQEKAVSGVAAIIRSAAQQKGHDPQLAEAMVRRELEYTSGGIVISPAGQLLTLTATEAARPVGPDGQPLLSQGTVADLAELLQREGRDAKNTVTLVVTAAEKIARLIESFSVILLALGILGLYIEFKTPGFGLPGIGGIICLMLFFWGHHIAGLAGMGEIIIFIIGIILLAIEIFVTPGFGILGISGLLIILFALFSAMAPSLPNWQWQTFTDGTLRIPLLKVAGAVVLGGVAAWIAGTRLPRSSVFKHIILQASHERQHGFSAGPETNQWLNQSGQALTDLRPAGIGLFDGQRLDIVTRGEYLPAGTPIKVVETHGARIIVEGKA
ncbi:MAG: NfeD family protein [Kiritimatiellia bacterium]